jgi:hypothetical protein
MKRLQFLGWKPKSAVEQLVISLLTGAYGFRAIYFAEKTVKLARTVVGSTLK